MGPVHHTISTQKPLLRLNPYPRTHFRQQSTIPHSPRPVYQPMLCKNTVHDRVNTCISYKNPRAEFLAHPARSSPLTLP